MTGQGTCGFHYSLVVDAFGELRALSLGRTLTWIPGKLLLPTTPACCRGILPYGTLPSRADMEDYPFK